MLRRAGDLFVERADVLADALIREAVSTPAKAHFEVGLAAQDCHEAAVLPSHAAGEVLAGEEDRLSFYERVPVGVVGVIAPYNAPIELAVRSVAPALALGNAVVLKPDPRTSTAGGDIIAAIFAEAGLPGGVLHVLKGGATKGAELVADPRVSVICFTGSTSSGRQVAELAARHLKRVHLELGGNSALIVLDDADLEKAVEAGAFGSFFHQGQVCMAVGRHLVHKSLYDRYITMLGAVADRTPAGPIIDERQLARIHEIVTTSVHAGARLIAGGGHTGLHYRPTVLADVPPHAPAFTQEIFGPVAPVTPFGDDDEAVKLACDTDYGLSLGVLTRDVMRGLALAKRIPAGMVHINDQTIDAAAHVPFGGVKSSGAGSRVGGSANLDAFTETRWVTVRGGQ
ncbi:aldehyde dehydrogenase [Lentzea sp. NBRC 105346]|nr:aldehyde dehydrogenase [Lentzea sp. NBRC 105346]